MPVLNDVCSLFIYIWSNSVISCVEHYIFPQFLKFPNRLLPLYFPRDKQEEEIAISKLPADVGDENGETVIDERKIRIKTLPNAKKTATKSSETPVSFPVTDVGLVRRLVT